MQINPRGEEKPEKERGYNEIIINWREKIFENVRGWGERKEETERKDGRRREERKEGGNRGETGKGRSEEGEKKGEREKGRERSWLTCPNKYHGFGSQQSNSQSSMVTLLSASPVPHC